MCLFIVTKRKRNIKSGKIDKRKRKILVSKAFHNIKMMRCLEECGTRMETKTRKTRMAKTEAGRGKRRSRKKEGRKGRKTKEKETKEGKDDGSKEGS